MKTHKMPNHFQEGIFQTCGLENPQNNGWPQTKMIDKQKQFHDAIAEDRKKVTELESLLAGPSLCKRLDNYLGIPKIAPMAFFLIMWSLLLGLLLFDTFLPSLASPYVAICWGAAVSVMMFLHNSYVSLAVSLCLAGIFILVEYSTQPLLCLAGVLTLMLGMLSIWRGLKWNDKVKGQQCAPSNPHSPSAQGADGR